MLKRPVVLAALAFALGIAAPSILRAAERAPFMVVDGDGWLTSNAVHDSGAWTALDTSRPAFGLQLSERNDLPFDKGTAGATFWVRNANCGAQFTGFGEPCGWQLGTAITQFRSLVVGGDGIEIDGLGLPPPYGRVVNATGGGARLSGILTNEFVDFSGVDVAAAPSWFAGFDLSHDLFAVRRAAPLSRQLNDAFTIDNAGNASASGDVASKHATQHAANQWAARAPLAHGTYTFVYAAPFAQTPVCVVTGEGSAHLRVAPTPSQCTVTSESAQDASMVDVVVVGNPN